MKKFSLSLALLFITIFTPLSAYGAAGVTTDIIIGPADASLKFQSELNSISGLDARNARLTFSPDRGVEGAAYPVNVDKLKVKDFDDPAYAFIGTTTESMKFSGGVYASNGKIEFTLGKIEPITLRIFPIGKAVNNVLNSYIGSSYIGSVDIIGGQIVAHVIANPNPTVTGPNGGNGAKLTPSTGGIAVDCNITGDTELDPDGPEGGVATRYVSSRACNFEKLLLLVDKFIKFLLVNFATPLAAIIFAYAGFLYISSGGSSEKAKHAKAMIIKVLFGYVIALAAWLIIKTILTTLGFPADWSFL